MIQSWGGLKGLVTVIRVYCLAGSAAVVTVVLGLLLEHVMGSQGSGELL